MDRQIISENHTYTPTSQPLPNGHIHCLPAKVGHMCALSAKNLVYTSCTCQQPNMHGSITISPSMTQPHKHQRQQHIRHDPPTRPSDNSMPMGEKRVSDAKKYQQWKPMQKVNRGSNNSTPLTSLWHFLSLSFRLHSFGTESRANLGRDRLFFCLANRSMLASRRSPALLRPACCSPKKALSTAAKERGSARKFSK